MSRSGNTMMKAVYLRRIVQLCVILVLVLLPFLAQNPMKFTPSRVVQGMIPDPSIFEVHGDTWAFSAYGFDLAHPLAFVEEVLASKVFFIPMVIAVIVPLLVTVLLGRVFCSWMCPVGLFLEWNRKLSDWMAEQGYHRKARIRDYRYTLLAAGIFLVVFLELPIFSVFDPPHVLGREIMYAFTHRGLSLAGAGFLVGILLFDLIFVHRGWCGKLCPSGGSLSLMGAKRLLRIRVDSEKCVECGKCDEACPYELAPMGLSGNKDFDWVTCDNCGLCRDACPEEAITYHLGRQ